mgnify:CR=1 FL=1
MPSLERIYACIDDHFADHLERVRTLVRQPSISGDGTGMAETAALVADLIREAGGGAEIVPTRGWPAGTYLVRLTLDGQGATRKIQVRR